MPDLTMTRGARIVTFGLLVLVLLIGGGNLWATYDQAGAVRHSAAIALQAKASVIQLCQAGNEFRAQQVTLWVHLVDISRPPAHETPVARRQRLATTRAFLAYVHRVFAPRDCAPPLTLLP